MEFGLSLKQCSDKRRTARNQLKTLEKPKRRLASSVASISENGLLTVDNQFLGIRGKTTTGEITTYIDKRRLGLFWTRVDIGQPNNQWRDVVYDYIYNGTHTFQLSSHGTYRITVTYVISGSGGEADTITQTITKTY